MDDSRKQLQDAKRRLSSKLRQVSAALRGQPAPELDPEEQRRVDAERKKAVRLKARRVQVSVSTRSLRQRKLRERNVRKWLRHYFPDVFSFAFTTNQTAIVNAILTAAKEGGDQWIAAPRGDGKTSIAECAIIYCCVTLIVRFPVIFSATGEDAERILSNIKSRLEENPLFLADYGEISQPAAALEGQANRSSGQVVYGRIGSHEFGDQRSKIKWSGRQIVFPTIDCKYSRAAGQIIATRGLDAAVRGIRYGTQRPDLALIDDPETRDIACSDDDRQREKLEHKLDQDIAMCAGQTRRLARVGLSTIMSRRSLSFRFSDPQQKPSFRGKRFRYLLVKPNREDMWDEFVSKQQADWVNDPRTHEAHRYYLDHKAQMDAGAVIGNPHRRGEVLESSALETYYVEVARIGQESVSTEFDNDPPEDSGPRESGITANRIQRQLSGYERRLIPPGCTVITQGIDVRKVALHFAVRAWMPNGTGYTIDYGVHEVLGTVRGSDEGLERAIISALHARMDFCKDEPYRDTEGKPMPIDLTLIDAGWMTQAVYHFCQERPGFEVQPAMGFGQSNGCVQTRFSDVTRKSRDKKPGDGWFLSRRPRGVWLVCMDADRWKRWEHERWMTAPERPGAMMGYGTPGDGRKLSEDEKSHMSYAKHLTSEIETEEIVRGRQTRRFKSKSDTNHYFDASYMSDVAGAMKGVTILRSSKKSEKPEPGEWFAAQKKQKKKRRSE